MMLRAVASTLARRAAPAATSAASLRGLAPTAAKAAPPAFAIRLQSTVAPSKQDEEEEKAGSAWDPLYSIPLGIAFAVPAIHYEWYLVNEETQLAACFMMFVAIVYRNFGGSLHETLEEDGKRILEAQNKVEDEMIGKLETLLDLYKKQTNIVSVFEDVMKIRVETFEKLNAAGKIKPQHDLKAQVEKALSIIAVEEAAAQEKMKMALMAEATAAVSKLFATDQALIKKSLDSAIGQLKGSAAAAEDPVKGAYLQFFKEKVAASQKTDPSAELKAAREGMITKLNSVAMNEGFLFRFGDDGKPQML